MDLSARLTTQPPDARVKTFIYVVVVVVIYRLYGPDWALPVGLGGWLTTLGSTQTQVAQP